MVEFTLKTKKRVLKLKTPWPEDMIAGLDKLLGMHKIAFTDIISWTLNLSGETLTGKRISRAILAGLKIGAQSTSRNFSN